MILNEFSWNKLSPSQKELVLHADNSHDLDYRSKHAVISNLAKASKGGKYDREHARDMWGYHADSIARSYHKTNGDKSVAWQKAISSADRKAIANHYETIHRPAIKEAQFNEDGTLMIESVILPREKIGMEILENILDKKPADLLENFRLLMTVLCNELVEELRDEMTKTVFKKETLNKDAKVLPNG